MRSVLIIVVFFLICHKSFADFYKVDELVDIPGIVVDVQDSVFKFILIKKAQIIEYNFCQNNYIDTDTHLSKMFNYLNKIEFLKCCKQLEKQKKTCQLYNYVGHVTAFKAIDSNSYITVKHFLFNNLAFSKAPIYQIGSNDDEVELLITNRHGELVFDTREVSDSIDMIFYNTSKNIDMLLKGKNLKDTIKLYLKRLLSDVMIIRLNKSIDESKVLEFASSDMSNVYYSLGYPKQTFDRVYNSDGINLFVSLGAGVDLFNKTIQKFVLSTSVDGVQGISGAPLVNEHGQVVSLTALRASFGEEAVQLLQSVSLNYLLNFIRVYNESLK